MKVFIVSAELGDGVNQTAVPHISDVIKAIATWADEAEPGDEFEVSCSTMTEAEFDALPEA